MTKNLLPFLLALSLLSPQIVLSQTSDDTIETLDLEKPFNETQNGTQLSEGPQTLPPEENSLPKPRRND
jgi:hypothetical protein